MSLMPYPPPYDPNSAHVHDDTEPVVLPATVFILAILLLMMIYIFCVYAGCPILRHYGLTMGRYDRGGWGRLTNVELCREPTGAGNSGSNVLFSRIQLIPQHHRHGSSSEQLQNVVRTPGTACYSAVSEIIPGDLKQGLVPLK
jgi:hypothetical protein